MSAAPQRARLLEMEMVAPPRKIVKAAPAAEPKRDPVPPAPTDLSPLCASIEKLVNAIKAQPVPQVTVEVPPAPAPVAPKPQSYVITVTRDRDKLPEKYRLDPVSS
jgi:hypothetical protein